MIKFRVLICSYCLFLSCNFPNKSQIRVCSKDLNRCIYVTPNNEKDELLINQTALYLYITESPHHSENRVPKSNYIKIRYSDECLFYVNWNSAKIKIQYSCLGTTEMLNSNSNLILEPYNGNDTVILKRLYDEHQLLD